MTLKTAVIGAGYLGKFHAEKYAQSEHCELLAVVDSNAERANTVAAAQQTQAYTDYRALYGKIDAASVVVPTQLHHRISRDLLQQGIHLLLEKPMTTTVAEADELIQLAAAQQCVLQIGHLERFNPAILAATEVLTTPKFIECHRLAPFKPRATDVDVVLDLMIHDIDIILQLVPSEVSDIAASGAPILSDSIDIANARISFANGCVANVTASRVSLKSERKMRIFQPDRYLSIDFQNHILSQHYKGHGESLPGVPMIESQETVFEHSDALNSEIDAFLNAIQQQTPPLVSGEDGRRALHTAIAINRLLQ